MVENLCWKVASGDGGSNAGRIVDAEIADEVLRGRGRRHVLRFTPIKLTRVDVRETLDEEQRGRKREDAVGSIGAWRGSSLTVRNFWRGANVSWERAKRRMANEHSSGSTRRSERFHAAWVRE